MPSTRKPMARWLKILLAFLALGIVYRVLNPEPRPTPSPSPASPSYQEPTSSVSNAPSQLLAQFKSEYAQLQAESYQCVQEIQENQRRMAAEAMSGSGAMPGEGPACQQRMQWVTARMALLETEISKLQGGNPNATVWDVSGIPRGSSYTPSSPGSSSSPSSSDGGIGAVENATRQGIRGTSLYTDEDGETHELPTREYYYRDRSSGQIYGSDSPNPPDNNRNYEQFHNGDGR